MRKRCAASTSAYRTTKAATSIISRRLRPIVIPGWTDGIPQMKVGEKARFWIPEELAYKGQPGRPQGMLVFEVELLEIKPGS